MMVDTQVRPSDVTKFPVIDAMLSVPREDYVPDDKRDTAYIDDNVDLGGGRVMLEPRTMGKMLDTLDIQPNEVVMDLGCGLGYSTALLARLAEFVVAVEEDEDRVAEAQANLSSHDVDNAAVVQGSLTAGAPKQGPYDVIVLQGAAEHVPEPLIDQLKDGGRMAVLFSDGALGTMRIGYKLDGAITWRMAFNAGAPVVPGFERHQAFTL
ncbi:protein-L-isoaspartate O-methyltransferase [Salibaculum griseiflavum]|jgi:protein-L-isoaspartate(D-aspartate) O-methyltransferase|uniref:Protein-L-isoaspartate O-methyltransferase n=2 Tax=Salibaculum griseiflavum TaxID=1914409 RepID=A0A2V1P154_9RHOB|nr:protein-L-isoaspartate O-methyltransferase [Salibaculum griseiflavum]